MNIWPGFKPRARLVAGALAACAGFWASGCGKEGPPLPPLRLVPAPASEIVARRFESRVEIHFLLPNRNQNGPGRVDLDHIEVFAMTVGPGAPTPPNRDLLSKSHLIGTIPVQPAPIEGEPVKDEPKDKRPAPGDRAVFVEELTAAALTPSPVADVSEPPRAAAGELPAGGTPPIKPGEPAPPATKPGDPASAVGASGTQPPAPYAVRVYALRGVSKSGRGGPPSPRVTVPLVDPAPGAVSIDVKYDERAYQIQWMAPVAQPDDPPVAFNVYDSTAPDVPLNPKPLETTKFEHAPVRFGTEQCFIVRSVKTVQGVSIESAATEASCTTARDHFPPATPGGLTVIATPEGISLSWNANTEEDLAGYFILRGEEPGDKLQALNTEPIRDTNYRDTSVKPGVTYVYAIVATDKATPRNVSAQSAPEKATAR